LFGKIKKEEFARRIFKKKSVFLPLKWLNKHFSNMTFFSLIQVLPVVYCGCGEIKNRILEAVLKPNLCSHFHGGLWGKYFEKTNNEA
jgi:hypothetical protein